MLFVVIESDFWPHPANSVQLRASGRNIVFFINGLTTAVFGVMSGRHKTWVRHHTIEVTWHKPRPGSILV